MTTNTVTTDSAVHTPAEETTVQTTVNVAPDYPRVPVEDAEHHGYITLARAAAAAGITTLTCKRRFETMGVEQAAIGETGARGRPPRLYDRHAALEAALAGVGRHRSQVEVMDLGAALDPAPAVVEAEAILAVGAENAAMEPFEVEDLNPDDETEAEAA